MEKSLELPVADDYEPSAGELDNFVYLTSKYTVGWIPRSCDHAVCLMMAGGAEAIRGNAGLTKLAETTIEFVWDHVCGEPEEPNTEQLWDHIKPILQEWYNTSTPEERAVTE